MRNRNYLINGFRPSIDDCVVYMKNLFSWKTTVEEKHTSLNTLRIFFYMNDENEYLILRAYHRLYKKLNDEGKIRLSRRLDFVHESYIQFVEHFEKSYGKIKQMSVFELKGVL